MKLCFLRFLRSRGPTERIGDLAVIGDRNPCSAISNHRAKSWSRTIALTDRCTNPRCR
jgi:hypothetical protein